MRKWIKRLRDAIAALDTKLDGRKTARLLSLCVCGAVLLIQFLFLQLPPYIGYSNDGSYASVLADCGLKRLDETDTDSYFNYYERVYLVSPTPYKPNTTPAPIRVLVGAAMGLDELLTGKDGRFDLRTLAAFYMLMYCAALYPFMAYVFRNVRMFSKGLFVALMSVLVFGDISLTSWFASLYSQPIVLICLLLTADCLIGLLGKERIPPLCPRLAASLVVMTLQTPLCAAFAFVCAVALLTRLGSFSTRPRQAVCVLTAAALVTLSFYGVTVVTSTQTPAQHYNAMTRGVLLQSGDPEETLSEFGIAPRFSVLADTYGEQNYPLVLATAKEALKGFNYTFTDIAAYYLAHPDSMLRMLDICTKASFLTRSDYFGYFVRSVGLPPKAMEPLMSIWATLKAQSAPASIGILFVLLAIIGILFLLGTRAKAAGAPRRREPETLLIAGAIGLGAILQSVLLILRSGDSEVISGMYVMSFAIDMLIMVDISQILRRINTVKGRR